MDIKKMNDSELQRYVGVMGIGFQIIAAANSSFGTEKTPISDSKIIDFVGKVQWIITDIAEGFGLSESHNQPWILGIGAQGDLAEAIAEMEKRGLGKTHISIPWEHAENGKTKVLKIGNKE